MPPSAERTQGSNGGITTARASSAAREATLRIRRMRQVSQAHAETKVQAHRDSASARQKMLRKTKSARDVTRRGTSIDSFLSANSKASSSMSSSKENYRKASLGSKLSGIIDNEVEEDDTKSLTSMGSFASSCGSIGTIGSTNSLRESFKNRRAQSARNVVSGGNTTSVHPSKLILPNKKQSLSSLLDAADEEVEDQYLRYCMANHNPSS